MANRNSFSEDAQVRFLHIVNNVSHDIHKRGAVIHPVSFIGLIGSLLYIKKLAVMRGQSLCTSPHRCVEDVLKFCTEVISEMYIERVIREFFHEIEKIESQDIFWNLIEFINDLDFQDDDYLFCYDSVAQSLSSNSLRYEADFYTPRNLCRLMSAVIDNSAQSVFNPFAGTMSFAIAMKGYDRFEGVEINAGLYGIAVLRLALVGNNKANINLNDVMNVEERKYDVIISNPPLGVRLENYGGMPFLKEKVIESDTYVWRVFDSFTNPYGMAVSLVVSSLLFDEKQSTLTLRKEILDKKFLDAVITLPMGIMPNTNISVSCVILRKGNLDKPVTMVDASSMFYMDGRNKVLDVESVLNAMSNEIEGLSKKVPYSEIYESLSWFPAHYVRTDEECPKGYQLYRLRDLVLESKYERFDASDTSGLAINLSDMAKDWQSCEIDMDSLQTEANLRGYVKLTNDAVLVSTVGELRPSIVHASPHAPVYIKRNLVALVPNNKVNSHFLCMVLANIHTQSAGIGARSISRNILMSEKIAIPDIELQLSAYNEARKATLVAKAREIGLQNLIQQMKAEYINEVRLRKHDLMSYTRELGSIHRRMSRILDSCTDISELKEKFADKLEKQAIAISHLSSLLEDLSREEVFGTPVLFNLEEYFLNLVCHHDEESGFVMRFDTDITAFKEYGLPFHKTKDFSTNIMGGLSSVKAPLINDPDFKIQLLTHIAPNDLERLVQNIIKNAVKHGFVNDERDDYEINIFLSLDAERKMFQIDFSNNGLPFPEGLTKDMYGRQGDSAGKNAGSGRGGHIVKKIVEHYGGDYDLIRDKNNSIIRIWLPIGNTLTDEEV